MELKIYSKKNKLPYNLEQLYVNIVILSNF